MVYINEMKRGKERREIFLRSLNKKQKQKGKRKRHYREKDIHETDRERGEAREK